ncbi:MAG: hypothetical protein KIT43_10155 [Bauldia sp.]|nr:hypothetical protein [Bauldia sp.]MCW5718823.1 hypothetical protein [Bauldia sp.]
MSLKGAWRAAIPLAAAIVGSPLAPSATAQEQAASPFELSILEDVVPAARLSGPVEPGAVEAWLRLIGSRDFRTALYLGHGSGGSPVAALQLGDILRAWDTVVVVEDGGLCDTACSLVFLRVKRGVALAPLEITASDGPDWLHDAIIQGLVDADVPDEVIAAFVAADGTVTRFDLADLERLGLRDRRGMPDAVGSNRFDLVDLSVVLPPAGRGYFTASALDRFGRTIRDRGEAEWFVGDHHGVRMLNVKFVAPSLGLDVDLLMYDTGLPGVADRAMLLTVRGGGTVTPTFVGVPVPANVPLLEAIGPNRPAPQAFVTAIMPSPSPSDTAWIALSPAFADRNADLLAAAEDLHFALDLGDGRSLWLTLRLDGVGRQVLDDALAVWP